jgi:glycosyltransferase involved in cell wall biosynthesis
MLFPYGDYRILADKLIRILTDESLRENLEKNALEWASTFTWENAAEQTMEIADSIVNS